MRGMEHCIGRSNAGQLSIVALVAALCLSPVVIDAQAAPLGVAGKWRMSIAFPNGDRAAGLELVQQGNTLTGRFVAAFAGGEVPLEGEWTNGTFTFSASTTGGPHPGEQLDFSSTLGEDGTLAGTLSASFGDFRWTAERLP